MGEAGITPVAQTYFEISDVKHKESAGIDYTVKSFTYLKNAYTYEITEPLSINEIGLLINEYKNDERGKDFDRCMLKGIFSGGYSSEDCKQNSPYLFFDIDVKNTKEKKENVHLLADATNNKIFQELQKVAVLVWRSKSGKGIAGILYVPQLEHYLSDAKDLHLLAGKSITRYLSEYLHNKTGIPRIVFDDAQSKFRQVRYLAEQTEKREINTTPFSFFYTVTEKVKELTNGVKNYSTGAYRLPYGNVFAQYDTERPVLDVALTNGFTEVSRNGNKVRVKHPLSTSSTSGVIDLGLNIYFNHSESFSTKKSFTSSHLLCYCAFKSDWKEFKKHLTQLGYKEKTKSEDEVEKAVKALKEKLSDCKNPDETIFSYCYDLQNLPEERKLKIVKEACIKNEFKKYFYAYLNLSHISYDKECIIEKFVGERISEVLDYADEHKKVILRAETGQGKTTAIFSIKKHRPEARILVLAPLTIIVDQNEKDHPYKAVYITGESYDARSQTAKTEQIVFATYQQGEKLLRDSNFDYLIVDEAHQLIRKNSYAWEVIEKLVPLLKNQTIIGLTGTPNNIFKKLGYKIINVDQKKPEKTKVELRFSNIKPFNIAISHLANVKGKALIEINNTKTLYALKDHLVKTKMYKPSEIIIFHSNKIVKRSDDFKNLANKRTFPDNVKVILTTSLIEEGLSIEQEGFTDVVYIETSYFPQPEPIKQFFARFRNKDDKRQNFLYLKRKEDQTPSLFNPEKYFNETLIGLEEDTIENEIHEFNTAFSNYNFYLNSGEINLYYLAYQSVDLHYKTMNTNQFCSFLEINYNIDLNIDDDFALEATGNSDSLFNEVVKQKIAGFWVERKSDVLKALAIHTESPKIRNSLERPKGFYMKDDELYFILQYMKNFEKLFNLSQLIKDLGHFSPDTILIDVNKWEQLTLRSQKKVKDDLIYLKVEKEIEERPESEDSKRLIAFALWAKSKASFSTAQMNRKLKELRVYNSKAYSFAMTERILKYFGFVAIKNSKTKEIKVS